MKAFVFFLGRNAGLVIAAVLALLWYFWPEAAVSVLNANLALVGSVAKMLPADWGGTLLGGLVALMKALGGAAKFISSYLPATFGPRTEATIRIVVETLLLLGEIKLVRWTYNICWVLTWPFRRKKPAPVPAVRSDNVKILDPSARRRTSTR